MKDTCELTISSITELTKVLDKYRIPWEVFFKHSNVRAKTFEHVGYQVHINLKIGFRQKIRVSSEISEEYKRVR